MTPEPVPFREVARFRNGMNFVASDSGPEVAIIGVADFGERAEFSDFNNLKNVRLKAAPGADDLVQDGDLVFVRSNGSKSLVGRCAVIRAPSKPVTFSGFCIRARLDTARALPDFVRHFFQHETLRRRFLLNTGGTNISNLSQEILGNVKLPLPPLAMQRQAIELLRPWDEAIGKIEALEHALERLANARSSALFEQLYKSRELLTSLGSVFEQISERGRLDLPLLAATQTHGVVLRADLGRRVVMPTGDTSSYKRVQPGDFVISLRSFEGGLERSAYEGLVSPAYTVLRPQGSYSTEFLRLLFKSRSFIQRMKTIVFGIRDGKQISFAQLSRLKVPIPDAAKQASISDYLGSIETRRGANRRLLNIVWRQRNEIVKHLLIGPKQYSRHQGEQ